MRRGYLQVLSIVTLFLGVYILPLGLRPLVTPDEFRYAEIPREMLVNHRWVVPKLNGMPYFEKPILGYWINAASINALGSNPFAVRLPSATAAGLTAFLLALLAVRASLSRTTSLLSAAILLTSLQFFGTGVFAVLDGPFTAFVTGTMVFFYSGFCAQDPAQRLRFLAFSGVFCGAAFLTKGFIGIVVPGMSIFSFLLFEGKLLLGVRMACVPALTAAATTLPWSILVHIQAPWFWRHFIWTEHVKRFLNPGSAQHPEPTWFFLPILVIGALPWTTLLPAAVAGLRAEKKASSIVVYASCWFVVPFVFFSLSSGKLATYILPTYPPLALLTAIGLVAHLRSDRRVLWHLGAVISACVLLIAAILLYVRSTELYDPSHQWKAWFLVLSLLVWSILSVTAARAKGTHALFLLSLSPILFMFSMHCVLPLKPMAADTPGGFLAKYRSRVHQGITLASDIGTVHAVCWTFGRDDVLLLGKPGELRLGIEATDGAGRLLEPDWLIEYAVQHDLKVLLFAGENATLETYMNVLPLPSFMTREGELVVAEFDFARLQSTSEGSSLLTGINR